MKKRYFDAATVTSVAMLAMTIVGPGLGLASASVTQCGNANGFSVSVEDSTTSCGFALNVAQQVRPSFNGDSVTVTASSPATGEDYRVICERLYQKTLDCSAGTGARVYLNS